jgi:copper homeostasis protein
MIRPRIGNFTYSEDEITTMEEEIFSLKEEGVTGFVFGCLTLGRTIDFPNMTR